MELGGGWAQPGPHGGGHCLGVPAGEVGVGGHIPHQRRLAHRAQHVRQGLPWGEGKLLETSEVMWIRHCGKILQTIAIKE